MSSSSKLPGSIVILVLIIGSVSWIGYNSLQEKESKTSQQTQDKKFITSVVKEVIRENPDLIIASLQSLQEKQAAEIEAKMKTSAMDQQEALHDTTHSPVLGNKSGDVKVVEFFDYMCGYCKRMGPVTKQLVAEDRGVGVILKIIPIMGPMSEDISKVAIAAYKLSPEKFADFHYALMTHNKAFDSLDSVLELAEKQGYQQDQLRTEMRGKAVAEELASNEELARKLSLQGTPIFYIGNEVIPGATDLDSFKAVIAKVRADR